MAQRQILAVTVPDDMEVPFRLVQTALEPYLEQDDRWRDVQIEPSLVYRVQDQR